MDNLVVYSADKHYAVVGCSGKDAVGVGGDNVFSGTTLSTDANEPGHPGSLLRAIHIYISDEHGLGSPMGRVGSGWVESHSAQLFSGCVELGC